MVDNASQARQRKAEKDVCGLCAQLGGRLLLAGPAPSRCQTKGIVEQSLSGMSYPDQTPKEEAE